VASSVTFSENYLYIKQIHNEVICTSVCLSYFPSAYLISK
jgi:hypothetical protein